MTILLLFTIVVAILFHFQVYFISLCACCLPSPSSRFGSVSDTQFKPKSIMRIILHCPVQIPSINNLVSTFTIWLAVFVVIYSNNGNSNNSTLAEIVADFLVADQQSNQQQSMFVKLCRNPRFDAAVAISVAHLMLFKGNQIWLLNLAEYNVGQPFSFNRTFGNLNQKGQCLPTIYNSNLYAWNVHHNWNQYSNQICLNRNGRVCPFTVEVESHSQPKNNQVSAENDKIGYDRDLLNITRNEAQWCNKDINANKIELAVTRQQFDKGEGPKVVRLIGLHFSAKIRYIPQSYDKNIILLKSELVKRSSEFYINTEESKNIFIQRGSNNESSLNDDNYLTVDNVDTFTVLPNGEVVVFFGNQFCYIIYYQLKCIPRSTSLLIGCSLPEHKFGQEQIYVVAKNYQREIEESANQTAAPTTAKLSTTTSSASDLSETTTPFTSPVSTPASTPETLSTISYATSPVVSSLSSVGSSVAITPTTTRNLDGGNSSTTASASSQFTANSLNWSELTSSSPPSPKTSTPTSTRASITNANLSKILPKSPYDIDYFYRKRDEFKSHLLSSNQTKRQTSPTFASQLNLFGFGWTDHSHYITIGCAVYFEIIRRAFTTFFTIALFVQLILSTFLFLAYLRDPASVNVQLLVFILVTHFYSAVDQF